MHLLLTQSAHLDWSTWEKQAWQKIPCDFSGIYQVFYYSNSKTWWCLVKGIILLGTPGFALLVNFVIKSSIWTFSAVTCGDSQWVDLPFKPTCVVSGLKLKAYYLYFYLRLTVGSKPFSHVFTQKEQLSSPQVSPFLQPHLVSVVAVQACRRTWAPKHTKRLKALVVLQISILAQNLIHCWWNAFIWLWLN